MAGNSVNDAADTMADHIVLNFGIFSRLFRSVDDLFWCNIGSFLLENGLNSNAIAITAPV